jgi:hypothetical protein
MDQPQPQTTVHSQPRYHWIGVSALGLFLISYFGPIDLTEISDNTLTSYVAYYSTTLATFLAEVWAILLVRHQRTALNITVVVLCTLLLLSSVLGLLSQLVWGI